MKKLSLFVLITAICTPALANDMYGMTDTEYTYMSPDADIMTDDTLTDAPMVADASTTAPRPASAPRGARDNYVGLRLHKNEHAAFKYHVNGGYTTTPRKDNFGLGLYVGNRLTDNVKLEFETAYTGAKLSKYGTDHDYDIWSNMLNVYMYHTFGGAVEPYAGVGIGLTGIFGKISGTAPHISDSALDLSAQVMVGVNFVLNDRVDLNLGAKYVRYGRVEYKTSGHEYANTRIDATEIYIGAAYKFDIK